VPVYSVAGNKNLQLLVGNNMYQSA